MTTADLSIFALSRLPGYALIDDNPARMLRPMDLRNGLSVKVSFPEQAVCKMSKRHKGKKLADFFANIMGHLIVTEKARAVLEAEPNLRWEWYPIEIVDQGGKPLKARYTWAHLLENYECLDRSKSKYTASSMDPASVHTFHKMVLDPKRVPDDRTLFRLKEQPGTKIIRSDLVKRLQAAGVTGFELLKLDSPILL
jgi:hypothetical protein